MNKIKLVADSTCDLSEDLIKKYDIKIIPLYVNFNEESYRDGVDIDTVTLYKKVKELGSLPKTAAISLGVFIEEFTNLINDGYDIIFMGISKEMSRTYDNACLARDEVSKERIRVVDSMNLSTGIGLLLLNAGEMINEGKSIDEIANYLEEANKKVRSQFVIPTMDYLYKGGRCSSLAKIFGTFLKIKPLIIVRDGKMAVGKKPRGNMKVALREMINYLASDLDKLEVKNIFITHSLAIDDVEFLREEILKLVPNINIFVTQAGCVISSHCGEGTIGILYMVK